MSYKMQEGIYFRSKPTIGNSFCIISLRASQSADILKIGTLLASIWNRLSKLKDGITADLNTDLKHRRKGNLSTLVAYGSGIFDLNGSKKIRPVSFSDNWKFKIPDQRGGGNILEGSTLRYSPKITENHLLFDHVLFQFIADTEFYTNRAAVEVWKELRRQEKESGDSSLRIMGLYQGFQRPDQRNWLGFHDGVSNLKSHERPQVITIAPNYLVSEDKWISYGTFITFMRIAIDIEKWEDTNIRVQERIIGRDKFSGCPLIGIDKNGRPIKQIGCPVHGTTEVIDRGNERFREHPQFGTERHNNELEHSHIGRTRPTDRVPLSDRKSLRIYRQGFEFLVPTDEYPGIIAGLNFISFQNTPERVFRSLTYQKKEVPVNREYPQSQGLDDFLSVLSAGTFLVPPIKIDAHFPGAEIFFSANELKNLNKLQRQNINQVRSEII